MSLELETLKIEYVKLSKENEETTKVLETTEELLEAALKDYEQLKNKLDTYEDKVYHLSRRVEELEYLLKMTNDRE